jgi:hypothetical protein
MYANGPKIVTDGLVLCLDAANRKSYPGSGTSWTDLSGNGNNGTFGGSTTAPIFNNGNGGSIVFDGSNDIITMSNSSSLKPVSAMTIEIFCYIQNNSTTWASIIQYPYVSNSHSSPYFEWGIYANMQSRYLHSRINGITLVNSNFSVWNFNEWSNLVLTYSSSFARFYVNGLDAGSAGVAPSISYDNPSNNILIGKNAAGGEPFEGRMGCIKMYDKALSANEVQQNYNALKGRYGLT